MSVLNAAQTGQNLKKYAYKKSWKHFVFTAGKHMF